MAEAVVQLFTVMAAFLALLSALFWIKASSIEPAMPMAYLSGPPEEVSDRVQGQAKWNSRGAFFAGLAALCQSAALIAPVVLG